METRANYALIGAFTLVGVLAALGLILWLAKVDVDRQYAYYDVLFNDVSGLGVSSSVRYNGLPVGQVVNLQIDETDPTKVRVSIEVSSDTPVKTDTVATLQSLGVTGVSTVALSGGTAQAEAIPENGTIPSKPSALESLFESAPELLQKAITLLEDINSVVNEENRAAVTQLLANLSSASGRLDSVLTDFEGLSSDLGGAARQIAGFTDRLGTLADTAETTLETATETLTTATDTLKRADGAVDSVVTTLDSAQTAFDTADTLMRNDLTDFVRQGTATAGSLESAVDALQAPAVATLDAAQKLAEEQLPTLLDELQRTVTTLEAQVGAVGGDASDLINRYDDVGAAVLARVQQTEKTIADIEVATEKAAVMIDRISETAQAATSFIETEGKPLAQEATGALKSVRVLADDQLPGLIDQANTTLSTLDREAQNLSQSAQTTLTAATQRLNEAEATIQALNTALDDASDALSSVETTSDNIDALVSGPGAELVASANSAVADAQAAIATVNDVIQSNLPGLMADVRSAAQSVDREVTRAGDDFDQIATSFGSLSAEGTVALAAATRSFERANGTLDAITDAMNSATSTLGTAETTFSSVNRIIDQDVDGMIADIRSAVTVFTTSVEGVSGNIDTISDEVLRASQSAANLIGTVENVVVENRRQMSDFLRVGLPQIQRFIAESRRLVTNMERLVDRIERDPARFLLGTNSSEFRR
ncbi:MAG: MlaD family protein [Pseudomonadota bacterium]